MVNRGLDLYELIFGAFFILKITGEGLGSWNWFWVFLPLILGFIHKFFVWVYNGTPMKRDLNKSLEDIYLDAAKKRSAKRAMRDIERK